MSWIEIFFIFAVKLAFQINILSNEKEPWGKSK